MTPTARIIELNRQHPEWTDIQIAAAVGCRREYVRTVCQRHGLSRGMVITPVDRSQIRLRLDDGMGEWLAQEARRMGAGVSRHAVILAILRDAMAEGG